MKDNIPKRLSTNEIIDNFKNLMGFRFDNEISKLLGVETTTVARCGNRESSTILFPIMDYLVANNISIEKTFYKVEKC